MNNTTFETLVRDHLATIAEGTPIHDQTTHAAPGLSTLNADKGPNAPRRRPARVTLVGLVAASLIAGLIAILANRSATTQIATVTSTPSATQGSAEEPTGTGDTLPVPTEAHPSTSVPAAVPSHYTVVVGDSLVEIAHRLGTTSAAIAAANGWTDGVLHSIYAGDVITIPANTNPSAPTTSSAATPPGSAPIPADDPTLPPIGSVITGERPTWLGPDGSVNKDLMGVFTPVGKDGLIIGYVLTDDLYAPPPASDGFEPPVTIVDAQGHPIGHIIEGVPQIGQ